ncbi:recombinase family protein [uncultured Paludibaculum sp.]|uniref:recombinase family protein n=1 Tax=uncultured Paludibaculum sp. TaxID=1765020 RepID=UPI002AAA9053|nr:recombinase family protein [uncultured Paludibaculum sp.]
MARSSAPRATANGSNDTPATKVLRCAIYTRKSTEEGLQQDFNSLDAQREAAEAFITSQKREGWRVVADHFDDGGYTGANMDRPALKRLLGAVEDRSVDCVVVYKVDRLSRSLMDFARIVEVFDQNGVSFVSVTQQFNTTTSIGRLTLNILLSFAQFEREIISERTRDKMSAARRKGKWIGGHPVLGYDIDSKGGRLIVNPEEADQVRTIFGLYLELGSLLPLLQEADRRGLRTKRWTTVDGKVRGGQRIAKGTMHGILTNAIYTGMVEHKGCLYPGEHERILDQNTWDRVHENLRRNNGDNGASLKNKFGALLKGLLFCVPCGTQMIHTYTMRNSKRYRYYVCYSAQQKGWKNCDTKSVPAQAIESAVLDSIRRLGTDPKLAEGVAAEALAEVARRRREVDQQSETQRRGLRQLNQNLAREAADTSVDTGARFERIAGIQRDIETTERRLAELTAERTELDRDHINANDLHRTLAEFDAIWSSLTTKEQEQMIHLLVAKVGYDGRTGKVTVNFSNQGAKEICQGKC